MVICPKVGPTPRWTSRLTVGSNITRTRMWVLEKVRCLFCEDDSGTFIRLRNHSSPFQLCLTLVDSTWEIELEKQYNCATLFLGDINTGTWPSRWPPLWSSGQSSWLQIRRPGFDSRHYQIFRQKKKKRKTSSGSGTGFTQPREYNWGATW
jgi:hypothetical protein